MSIRTERLAAVIQRDLGNIIQQSYQKSGSFITVTQVEVTQDLLIAKVFLSIYAPGKDEDAIFSNLVEHNASIRKELASKIRHQVRRIPELHFNKDESAEYVDKMENLFDQIREERKQRSTGEEE
ncbi:30S ribosome-binding factor RbfA [Balneolaceae bacterium YR4-1]|uniref:Ribosome-binding factor A n=1 Tax=Halalkalibaculum roseum TaxID=2709311 RepID=A0A6M1STS7_9BACT|nr:30S ribosome-binding factor RbfA [Halalkalibaculum roseum]NGP76330.1 30S ribosome-binding factor RbfA [Halalkalibaculum roseum]